MMQIDRITLRLPPELQTRAHEVAEALGQALARLPTEGIRRIDRLAISGDGIDPGAPVTEIAGTLATRIGAGISGARE